MRLQGLLYSAAFLLSSIAGDLAAQASARDGGPEAPLARALDRARTDQVPGGETAGPGWRSRALSALGGAAIGAGLGYFASQIATGDWEPRARKVAVDRPLWAAVGGSVGLALGISFPLSGNSPPGRSQPLPSLQRTTINREELRELGVTHAYEAVEVLRPEWLHDRGPTEWGDTPDDGRSVYVEGTRVGNLGQLRNLSTADIETIRFIDAPTATARWGAGNSRGALLVLLMTGNGDDAG